MDENQKGKITGGILVFLGVWVTILIAVVAWAVPNLEGFARIAVLLGAAFLPLIWGVFASIGRLD